MRTHAERNTHTHTLNHTAYERTGKTKQNFVLRRAVKYIPFLPAVLPVLSPAVRLWCAWVCVPGFFGVVWGFVVAVVVCVLGGRSVRVVFRGARVLLVCSWLRVLFRRFPAVRLSAVWVSGRSVRPCGACPFAVGCSSVFLSRGRLLSRGSACGVGRCAWLL